MNRFVHRDNLGSEQHHQNGQRISQDRQAIAANAKVIIKKGPHAQQNQFQASLPARGLGNAQNSSAAIKHAPQRRHSGQSQKNDLYHTDAESIDTTVNQSVIQVGESQAKNHHHQQQAGVLDPGEATDDEEEVSQYEEEEEAEYVNSDLMLTQEESEFLQQRGQTHLSRPEAVAYVRGNVVPGLPVIEGDSYPPTSDGHLTEMQGESEPFCEMVDGDGPVTPSPRNPRTVNRRTHAAVSTHNGAVVLAHGQAVHGQTRMFQQSANIRGLQRLNANTQQVGKEFLSNPAPAMPVLTQSHTHPNRELALAKGNNLHKRPEQHVTFSQPQQSQVHQSSNTIHATRQPVNQIAAPMAHKRRPSDRTAPIPTIQQQPAEQPTTLEPAHDPNSDSDGDYDLETLHAMRYDDLRDESFDTDPRASDQPLSNDIAHKPLIERLTYVQTNFDAGKQTDFFHDLPTTEWEDAGDWFLDQFSSIIKRTKEARQKKRKLAQEFEKEVEKRHKHVSKKQHQVESAMSKMQTQGQGLVPRSPRPSVSPRPKKR
jgi:hypothetical protein